VGIESGERIAAICFVDAIEEGNFIVTLTKRGQIKKSALSDYKNYRETGLIGVKIDDGDELLAAHLTDGNAELLIGTRNGYAIRFHEDGVRPMGRATMGVKAIDLQLGDEVVGMAAYDALTGGPPSSRSSASPSIMASRDRVLTVCEFGYGKQTPIDQFPLQRRAGKGVILITASDRNGPVVGVALVGESDQLMLITDKGQTLRTDVEQIRVTGRSAQGVSIMKVADGERVVAIETFPWEADEEASDEEARSEDAGSEEATSDEAAPIAPQDAAEAQTASSALDDTAEDDGE